MAATFGLFQAPVKPVHSVAFAGAGNKGLTASLFSKYTNKAE
jgi:hypothetical protein